LEIFYGHLVYFVVIWYIFPRFGTLYHENLVTLAHWPRFTSLVKMRG
jgi:hypothetical protein